VLAITVHTRIWK